MRSSSFTQEVEADVCPQCHGVLRSSRGGRARTCPDCDVLMVHRQLTQEMAADICPQCEGMWLDHGELKRALHTRISERSNPRAFAKAQRTALRCPDCDEPLLKRRFFPNRSDIIVKQCTKCTGSFLEDGELDRLRDLIESFVPEDESQSF